MPISVLYSSEMKYGTALAVLVCLVGAVLRAQSRPEKQNAVPRTVTVCEILSQPRSYDGELVSIRGGGRRDG